MVGHVNAHMLVAAAFTMVGTALPAAHGSSAASFGGAGCVGLKDLGTLGGLSSFGVDVNDHGEMTGGSQTAAGAFHAFVWSRGEMIDLGTLGGTSSHATAINDHGEMTGESETTEGAAHAFVWSRGEMDDLSAAVDAGASSGRAINERGEVTGSLAFIHTRTIHAFLWSRGQFVDLGTPYPGWMISIAWSKGKSCCVISANASAM